MCKFVGAYFFLIVSVVLGASARPSKGIEQLMTRVDVDTEVVESTIRETRQAVPSHIEDLLQPGTKEAYLHTYGDDEDAEGDVQGYHKRSNDKGSDGYKHSDSFHKKGGDSFGYEHHSEFGKDGKAKLVKNKKSSAGKSDDGHGDATHNLYKVIEDVKNGKGVAAVEDYDSGYYADGGDSEGYTDGESEGYTNDAADEGDEEQANLESENDNSGYNLADEEESSPYTAEGGESEAAEADYDY